MKVYHQSSSQSYIPPSRTAEFPVKLLPDVIDTLATSEMDTAPAKSTQDRQDNIKNNSEISCPLRLLTFWLQCAYIYIYIYIYSMYVYKCVYHDHYQTYWIVPPF